MIWVRRYLAVVGVAAMLGALFSLTLPLHLDAVDRHGQPLPCGTALQPNRGVVTAEDHLNEVLHHQNAARFRPSDYSGECAQWITLKRYVALGVATSGALMMAAAGPRRRRTAHGARAGIGHALRCTHLARPRHAVPPITPTPDRHASRRLS